MSASDEISITSPIAVVVAVAVVAVVVVGAFLSVTYDVGRGVDVKVLPTTLPSIKPVINPSLIFHIIKQVIHCLFTKQI